MGLSALPEYSSKGACRVQDLGCRFVRKVPLKGFYDVLGKDILNTRHFKEGSESLFFGM